MTNYELPLVFFTVLCQWGVGVLAATTALQYLAPALVQEYVRTGRMRLLAVLVFAAVALGTLLSLGHLGTPSGMFRAFSGFAHSWLSREGLAFLVLNAVTLAWTVVFFLHPGNASLQRKLGLLASLVGVVAVLASGQVYYQMIAHPFWHTPLTHINFVGTALLLGFATAGIAFRTGITPTPPPGVLSAGLILGTVMVLTALLGYSGGLSQQGPLLESARLLFGSSWLLAGFIAFAAFLPAALAVCIYRNVTLSKGMACVYMALFAAGAVCSRMLFFGSVMRQPWF
ncbi:MAG: dimethyl sulfoxide reductase anchor subunit [Deltaproteobacteria bacterium]|jgi:anaerobic dimethyl sulfoxide reductase subunit C (anchor subunit)|nr:dimethyl sulfoxide reductase anchor subunit [Deltaproteobacteria bacterium]